MKGRELEKVEGVFMNYFRTRMWFRPEIDEKLRISPHQGFSGSCQGNCPLSWTGEFLT